MPALLVVLLAVAPLVAPGAGAGDLFAGADLETWQGLPELWRFKHGELIDLATERVPRNEFIYALEPVGDFHLSVEVKLEPNRVNSGIQFRSSRLENGHAVGYQADIGHGVWGRLYHEHGRGQLDWTDAGENHVRPGEWNRYEILAVGHRIWTAINGNLSVATVDEVGELEGLLAFQIHSGPPQEVRFRDATLTRDPVVELVGMDEAALEAAALDASLDWRPRDQAVRGLARTRAGAERLVELGEQQKLPEELHEVAGAALSNVMQVPVRERAAKVYPLPATKDAEPVPQMTDLLVFLGDVERGREVFAEATCSECYIVAGDGTEYGPDLSTLGSKLAKKGLYESILDPSASISPTDAPYLFELANGELVVGLLVSETDDRLVVRTEGGVVTDYEPSDLSSQMMIEELIDLAEYLTKLR